MYFNFDVFFRGAKCYCILSYDCVVMTTTRIPVVCIYGNGATNMSFASELFLDRSCCTLWRIQLSQVRNWNARKNFSCDRIQFMKNISQVTLEQNVSKSVATIIRWRAKNNFLLKSLIVSSKLLNVVNCKMSYVSFTFSLKFVKIFFLLTFSCFVLGKKTAIVSHL